jgi:hypothetical protein
MERLRSTSSVPTRPLREEEIELISSLIRRTANGENFQSVLQSSRVMDMKDGNMGSIRFAKDERRIMGKILAEAQYNIRMRMGSS